VERKYGQKLGEAAEQRLFSCSNRFQQLRFFGSKIRHALSTNLRKELSTLSKDPHQQNNLTSTANKQDEALVREML